MIEVGSKSDEAISRETIADLFEEVGAAPPCMQNQHTWSAAMLGNCQIGADRSAISLKFSHTTLLNYSRNTVLQEAENTCFVHRCLKLPRFWSEAMNSV